MKNSTEKIYEFRTYFDYPWIRHVLLNLFNLDGAESYLPYVSAEYRNETSGSHQYLSLLSFMKNDMNISIIQYVQMLLECFVL